MALGLAKPRRFQFTEPPSWKKMHSHTQVSLSTFDRLQFHENQSSALQCWLECEPGYVAQRVPLITCVDGNYAKGCHYFDNVVKFSQLWTFRGKSIPQSKKKTTKSITPATCNVCRNRSKVKDQGGGSDPSFPLQSWKYRQIMTDNSQKHFTIFRKN